MSKSVAQVNIQFDDTSWVLLTSSTTPPPYINLSMPLEVMATYIVADTLCKTFDVFQIDSIANRLSADSIAIAFKAMVRTQDYHPLLFKHALFHSSFIGSPGYHSTYKALMDGIERNYFQRVRSRTRYDSIRYFASAGIYHVRVLNQEHRVDSVAFGHWSSVPYVDKYSADLMLLRSIFGSTTPFTCYEVGSEYAIPCLKTGWNRYPREREGNVHDDSSYYRIGPGYLVPGAEYIVFLRAYSTRTRTGGKIEYGLSPHWVLPVANGLVYDLNNICGFGTEMDLQQFISALRVKILDLE